jgi:hypothetical protein
LLKREKGWKQELACREGEYIELDFVSVDTCCTKTMFTDAIEPVKRCTETAPAPAAAVAEVNSASDIWSRLGEINTKKRRQDIRGTLIKRKEKRKLKKKNRQKIRQAMRVATANAKVIEVIITSDVGKTTTVYKGSERIDRSVVKPGIELSVESSGTSAMEMSGTVSLLEGSASLENLKSASALAMKRPRPVVILERLGPAGAMDRSETGVTTAAKKFLQQTDVERSGRTVIAVANDELVVIDANASFMTLLAAYEGQILSRQKNGKAILCLDVEVVSDGVYSQFSQIGCVLSVEGEISTFEAKVGGYLCVCWAANYWVLYV